MRIGATGIPIADRQHTEIELRWWTAVKDRALERALLERIRLRSELMSCERCHKDSMSSIGSVFNTQLICLDCKEAEDAHPDYARARAAEAAQVKAGNFNFEGVGLPSDL